MAGELYLQSRVTRFNSHCHVVDNHLFCLLPVEICLLDMFNVIGL